MVVAKKKRKFKYTDYILTAIKAAKMSIEMFNRIDVVHKDNAALIFSAQAWELLAKGLLVKDKNSTDTIKEKKGRTITGEKAVNKICYELQIINKDETAVIQQIISLRNEAMHDVLPKIPSEIITHLLYYSVKSFRKVLKENFKTYYKKDFNQNFLSISFDNHTFYSDKVGRLFADSKKYSSEKNRLLYLLDRGVDFANKKSSTSMQNQFAWHEKIKKMPRKSRVTMHLPIYKHISDNEDIRFIPVETKRGYKAEVSVTKTKNKKDAMSVIIKKTDPNVDYPYTTTQVGKILKRHISFVSKMAKKLEIRENEEYCYLIKTGKNGLLPKYSDPAITYMKKYLEKYPKYNPYEEYVKK